MIKTIPLSEICLDERTQSRCEIDEDLVSDYRIAIEEGAQFPPLVVFYDGKNYYLADGYHRYYAEESIGTKEVSAEVYTGQLRDAILYSVGANETHGKRRTLADKRKSVQTMLGDHEWSKMSDRAIADACRVSHPFVAKMRERGNVTTPEADIQGVDEHEPATGPLFGEPAEKEASTSSKPRQPKDKAAAGYLDSLVDLLQEAAKIAEALEENEILFDINGAIKIAKKKNRE
jgi:hypothetical protein